MTKADFIRKYPQLSTTELLELAQKENFPLLMRDVYRVRSRDRRKNKQESTKDVDPIDMLLNGLVEKETFENKIADLDDYLVVLYNRKKEATKEIDAEIAEINRKKNILNRYIEMFVSLQHRKAI